MRRIRTDDEAGITTPASDRITASRRRTILARLIFLDGVTDQCPGSRASGGADGGSPYSTGGSGADDSTSRGTISGACAGGLVTRCEKRRQ